MKKISFKNIDQYLTQFPGLAGDMMQELRETIKQAAPDAEEIISYNMPAFKFEGKVLVYFAGYEKHIGFYPTGQPIIVFKDELKKYKTSKGAVQFPLGSRIPKTLVKKMVAFRIKDNREKALIKKKTK